ncbi:MAG TPA: DMT family transporter [Pirellulales bacterium]|jgi:drug/metabolite transporter (DMT)-like permease|nr:DMT family transporter [Pirellulales bacterium]
MNRASDHVAAQPPAEGHTVSPGQDGAQVRPVTVSAALLAVLCAVLWGGLAVAVRFTQDGIPPLATAGLRFGIATLLLAGTILGQGASLALDRQQLLAILPVGLLLFLQIGSYHYGQSHTSSAHGSVMIGSYPVFVALVAHFLLKGDRLSPGKLTGLLVAFAGLLAIVAGAQSSAKPPGGGDAASLYGDAVILVSSMLIGVNTVMSKRALAVVAVPKLLFWSNVLATGLFFATSFVVEGDRPWKFSPAVAWGLAYQSVVVAWICFLIWTALLRHHRASQIAVFGFAQPLCGMVFGIWLRGDPMTLSLAFGGAAVATGIVLVTRAEG